MPMLCSVFRVPTLASNLPINVENGRCQSQKMHVRCITTGLAWKKAMLPPEMNKEGVTK